MALPPLELFSLARRLPCCRVAFSFLLLARKSFKQNRLCSIFGKSLEYRLEQHADVAQLVEQLIRNQQVNGSSPFVGSSVFSRRSSERPIVTMGLSRAGVLAAQCICATATGPDGGGQG